MNGPRVNEKYGSTTVYDHRDGIVFIEWPELDEGGVALSAREGVDEGSTLAHAFVTELRRAGWKVEPPAWPSEGQWRG